MGTVLANLEPKKVWSFFEDLTQIPRGSYNEKQVSDYCVAFAKERGLEVYQDELWNVVIIKEASKGYEDVEPLIIQGHLDMVCEKKPDCKIDFTKDGLEIAVDGDFVYAKGTTLGGDDGIAIAYALAILDDDSIAHPRLEMVFTTSEEVGMDGAAALDTSVLKGHTVLNLDSEEEGHLLVGCAGGSSVSVKLPVKRCLAKGIAAALKVDGLLGGHSGVEIDKGRANSNLLLARVLGTLSQKISYQLISVAGGLKDNAIPRESDAQILLLPEQVEEAKELCKLCEKELQEEYAATDANICIHLEIQDEKETMALEEASAKEVLALLMALPNGIQSMSGNIKGLVETSLNLGILKTDEDSVYLSYAVRSSVGTAKERLQEKMKIIAEYFGAEAEIKGNYPAWEFRRDSKLREDMICIYKEMFGEEPKVEAIHAGLECGLLAKKIPNMDCVSMGPNMYHIHTTEEKISISSVARMWDYILEIVKRK